MKIDKTRPVPFNYVFHLDFNDLNSASITLPSIGANAKAIPLIETVAGSEIDHVHQVKVKNFDAPTDAEELVKVVSIGFGENVQGASINVGNAGGNPAPLSSPVLTNFRFWAFLDLTPHIGGFLKRVRVDSTISFFVFNGSSSNGRTFGFHLNGTNHLAGGNAGTVDVTFPTPILIDANTKLLFTINTFEPFVSVVQGGFSGSATILTPALEWTSTPLLNADDDVMDKGVDGQPYKVVGATVQKLYALAGVNGNPNEQYTAGEWKVMLKGKELVSS